MAKITLTLCDVQPCNMLADRIFQIDGRSVHVCGEGCYAKYWSREYQRWKKEGYDLNATRIAIYEEQCSGRTLKVVSDNTKLLGTSQSA